MGQLHELMFHLGTIAPNQKKNISSTYQLYLECKRLIDSHYPQSLTIQDLTKELSVHRSYLSSVFKEFNTLSPKEYLLYVRMHRAKQLLENTQESIKVIAYSVGFSDPLHFSKAYKQYFQSDSKSYKKRILSIPTSEKGNIMKSYQAVYQILSKETDYISGEKSQKNYP